VSGIGRYFDLIYGTCNALLASVDEFSLVGGYFCIVGLGGQHIYGSVGLVGGDLIYKLYLRYFSG
jgi:hypothetical protein